MSDCKRKIVKSLLKYWDELTPLERRILIMETREPKKHKSKARVLNVRPKKK